MMMLTGDEVKSFKAIVNTSRIFCSCCSAFVTTHSGTSFKVVKEKLGNARDKVTGPLNFHCIKCSIVTWVPASRRLCSPPPFPRENLFLCCPCALMIKYPSSCLCCPWQQRPLQSLHSWILHMKTLMWTELKFCCISYVTFTLIFWCSRRSFSD